MHALLSLLLAPPAAAQDADPAGSTELRALTAADLEDIRSARGLALSPDGRRVAWEEWRPDGDEGTVDLWLAEVSGRSPARRLSFGEGQERRPAWSPGGRSLYFDQAGTLGEERGRQVFRMDLETGAVVQLTEVEGGLSHWALDADGAALILVSHDAEERQDRFRSLREDHPGPTYVESSPQRATVQILDLGSFRTRELEVGEHAVFEVQPSPDGRQLALLVTPDSPLIFREGESRVALVDRVTGELSFLPDADFREGAPSPYGWLHDLAWSPDSESLAFAVSYDGHPTTLQVARLPEDGDGAGATVHGIPRDGDWSMIGGSLQWHPRGQRICFTVSDHARIQARCQDPDAPVPSELLTPGEGVLQGWAFVGRGRSLVAVQATTRSPGEVVLLDVGSATPVRTLSELNPQLAELALPRIERFTWTAPDGVEVEGILELPPGYEAERDGPLPTVLHLHGGPTWATHRYLRLRGDGHTTFAARGWALLSPNYRGSTGYGDEFMVDLIGRENDVEVADILAGVDALVAAGVADPDQLAVMGWSNGGYLTNCLISRTDRFKAASSGAGVFDQTLQWALEDTPGHVINYMEGLPWEQPEAVQAASPLFAADRISTPTVIHVGEHDPRVPAAHARALHRALSFYLDVPTELIVYPGEGHGLSRQAHRAARVAWDEAWFDWYVRGLAPGGPASEGEVEPIGDR